jgi:hypothetical protein
VDCANDRPDEKGNEPTCCVQGREFNKIAVQLLAFQEGTVLDGVLCKYFVSCGGENLQTRYCTINFDSLSYFCLCHD